MKGIPYTVFGATGFIGDCLANDLRRRGRDVLTPTRDEPVVPGNFLGHVIYCIGLTADFRNRPFETVDAHVGRLRDILERGHFSSFVYLSSTRVYKNAKSTDEDTALVLCPADPDDLYNASKIMGEALCLGCNRPGTKVVRLSNVYGADIASENFLSSVLRDAVTKGRVVLRTAPDSTKDYIAIEDVVAMLPQIAERGESRIYNLANGRNTTHRELVEGVRRITGCEVVYEPGTPKVEYPRISIRRLRDEFNFAPAHVMDHLGSLVEKMQDKVRAA